MFCGFGNLMSDIDNQFCIARIQFSILVLARNNFERFRKPYYSYHIRSCRLRSCSE